ncbi:MAG TPA: polysaccharide deacetylase family protein [Kofleriaceae bacterium]
MTRWWWLAVVAACGDNGPLEQPIYTWNGEHEVTASGLDLTGPGDPGLYDAIDHDTAGGAVVLFYGHDPPHETSYETLESLLSRAEADGLPTLTYADLAHGPSKAGICLSFDDDEVEDWIAMRGLLAAHHAHVSFFVTGYIYMTDTQHAMLHELAADGHTIEAHGVNHQNAVTYIAAHGLDAYLTEEVQPSIDVLRADGFDPVAYAHPGGAHTPELDDALASRIRFARGIHGALE